MKQDKPKEFDWIIILLMVLVIFHVPMFGRESVGVAMKEIIEFNEFIVFIVYLGICAVWGFVGAVVLLDLCHRISGKR